MSASRSRATSRRSVGSVMATRAAVRLLAITRSPLSSRRSSFFLASRASCALRNAYISGGLSRSFLAPSAIVVHRCCRLIQVLIQVARPSAIRRLRTIGVVQDREGPERTAPKYSRFGIAAPHLRRHDRPGYLRSGYLLAG